MASEELPPLVLENPDEYQGKDIEDVLKAWKKDQAVMKSTRIMLLLVFKSKTELASEASARASAEHELYVKAETALARERADTTIVVANRAWLEHICLEYIKDYRTATYQKNGQRPPLPIPDSDIKNTSITNVFTEHVLGLVFTPAQAPGARDSGPGCVRTPPAPRGRNQGPQGQETSRRGARDLVERLVRDHAQRSPRQGTRTLPWKFLSYKRSPRPRRASGADRWQAP